VRGQTGVKAVASHASYLIHMRNGNTICQNRPLPLN
jgi:hypothetical protein